ncbi:MAG TPA: hypothetical protein ENF44_05590 [Deltaproteobacteria bacterium]|nr:hypothetical protein [Deltaproteobacteria bacterium]
MAIYRDRILKIDLTSGKAVTEGLPQEIKHRFIGGRGFGAWYLYKELRPGADPLAPDNKLLFLPGVLAGTVAPGFSRWIVVTKSPLTGCYARSVGGGKFGAAIKIAGYDFIVVEGRAERPVYVYIDKEGVKILDAGDLWGLDTQETQKNLWERHGRKTHIACIGPAGERLVRFAAIIHERRAAARCGVGTVMGAKNLKAIAVNIEGCAPPSLHDKDGFLKLVKEHNRVLKDHPRRKRLTALGTTSMTLRMHELGIFPVRNFQRGRLSGVQQIGAEAFSKLKVADYGCFACTTRCGNVFEVREGPYRGSRSEGPEYETIFAFGGEPENTDIGSLVAADDLCDRLGLDTISTGVTIGFLMELFDRGIVTSEELDGLEPRWGNHALILQLIEKIARREGVGQLLGEGVRRAAEAIGRGAERYAMHCKGLELPGYDPRAAKAHGLSYATSNIGGSHMYGYARQEISGATEPRPVDRLAEDGKGEIAGWNQIKKAREETGVLCNFADSGITPRLIGDLYVSATGVPEFGELDYLDRVGERIVALERSINVREGFRRRDDRLPERFLKEPLQEAGPSTGAVIEGFDRMLDDYYHFMGYDSNGVPTEEKLRELGLEEVAAELQRISR